MAKNQKKYTQEFKQQIVDLYNTGNYSFPQLSSEYGVAKSTILNWVRNLSPIQVSETGKKGLSSLIEPAQQAWYYILRFCI